MQVVAEMKEIPSDPDLAKEVNAELRSLERDLIDLKYLLQTFDTRLSEDGEHLDVIVRTTTEARRDVERGTETLETIVDQIKKEPRMWRSAVIVAGAAAIGGAVAGPIGMIFSAKLGLLTAGLGTGFGAGLGLTLL